MEVMQVMSGGGEVSLPSGACLDLSRIGQRIVDLADLSVMEHLQAVGRSQADGLLELVRKTAAETETR